MNSPDFGLSLAFWILASVTVFTAILVVTLRNILHAALALIVCFAMIAGIYITLRADFLAAVQILIYVGAIAVLVIFGIMLTRNPAQGNPSNRLSLPALFLSVLVLGAILYTILGLASWGTTAAVSTAELASINQVADLMFNVWLLPFEVVSVLLLAAMIGAIVLTREATRGNR